MEWGLGMDGGAAGERLRQRDGDKQSVSHPRHPQVCGSIPKCPTAAPSAPKCPKASPSLNSERQQMDCVPRLLPLSKRRKVTDWDELGLEPMAESEEMGTSTDEDRSLAIEQWKVQR